MTASDRSRDWPLRLALAVYFAIAAAVTLHWPPWGDEAHYLNAVRLFGQGLSIDLLRSYPEMTAPLTFITYAQWGHLAGFDTAQLRLLSPILAMATAMFLISALRASKVTTAMVIAGTVMVVANPYFVGLSVFVFTDMLALMMLTATVAGVARDRAWLTGLGIAGAVLSRQYLAFLAPAVIGAVAISEGFNGAWRNRHVVAACAGLVPLACLVWLWNGTLAPLNELRGNYLTGAGLHYNVHALALYLAAPGFYLAPLLLWRLRDGLTRRSLAAGLVLACITVLFPIEPAIAQVNEGSVTVGFVHRALTWLLPAGPATAVWFAGATLFIAVMTERVRALWTKLDRRRLDAATMLPWTGIAGFLLLMPFTYMPWEKYALPLFILSVLALCAPASHDEADSGDHPAWYASGRR